MLKITRSKRNVTFLTLLVFALGFPLSTFAQKEKEKTHKHVCKLKCKVYDAKTKLALPQANVQVTNLNIGEVTDHEGMTEIHLHEGCTCTCDLKISFIGYKDFFTKLSVSNDTTISIYLDEDSELLEGVDIETSRVNTNISSLTVS